MKRSFAVLALLCTFSAAPVLAQVTGLPTRNAGIPGGLTVGAEAGFTNNDYGEGKAYGARASLGMGPFGISALVSSFNPDGSAGSFTAYGGALNLKVFGGPLIPLSVTLQAGAEYADPEGPGTVTHAPIGLGIAVRIPNPSLAISPWIAPRVDVTRFSDGSSDTQTNFGLSGGIDFNLIFGLNLEVSYDRVWADNGAKPSTFGLGAGWTFHIPGL
jgi:hypothetical protein